MGTEVDAALCPEKTDFFVILSTNERESTLFMLEFE